jgi:hypothetical protein
MRPTPVSGRYDGHTAGGSRVSTMDEARYERARDGAREKLVMRRWRPTSALRRWWLTAAHSAVVRPGIGPSTRPRTRRSACVVPSLRPPRLGQAVRSKTCLYTLRRIATRAGRAAHSPTSSSVSARAAASNSRRAGGSPRPRHDRDDEQHIGLRDRPSGLTELQGTPLAERSWCRQRKDYATRH